jgi:hypothetical protein
MDKRQRRIQKAENRPIGGQQSRYESGDAGQGKQLSLEQVRNA